MEIFDLYGIKEKVLSITFDNAAISLFKQTLKPHYGGSFFHQRCACHIINLVVQDGMKQFEVYLDNVRAALSFISSSGTRMQEFVQNIQWFGMTPKWLPTIVPNRWNAAYLMLEVALSYKDMVTTYYNGRNADRLLTEADWQICQCFYYFLKVFYDATVTLSGVYYPTSHHALHKLYDIANAFEMHRDVEIFSATVAFMENKFKKYWQKVPFLYCVAAALDPRMKLHGVDSLLRGIAEKLPVQGDEVITIQDVRAQMSRMFESYNRKYGGSSTTSSTTTSSCIISPSSASWQNIMNTSSYSYSSSSSSSRSELENYYETNFSAFFTNFDLLNFWKGQSTTFPVLSRMARDILTTPVSTVASEQVFSCSGRVLEEQRARMNEDILEALMCVKDWEDARRRGQQFEDDMLTDFLNLDISDDSTTTAGGSNTL